MDTFAFYPAREEQRRADGLNFAVAVGASASAARVVAETLLGEPNALVGWSSIDLTSAPATFVTGLPVGARAQSTWPNLDRGGSFMRGT
ncbi:hypothetical protein [Martelella limonii]|uniref:hypothetical protein n=1 Tax=Martelella limonii TaxID=1647649 RepID=UPI001580D106|nr:hypothetical protein [Martelella limonii]